MLVKYPISFPTEAAKSLLSIVKSRDIAKQKSEFALAVWNVQGYIQSKALVNDSISFSTTAVIYDLEDAVATAHELDSVDGAFGSWFTDASLHLLKPIVKWALQEIIKQL